jgi:hypothetical protein
MNVAVLAAIPAQTGLLAWLEARGWRTLRSTEADLSRIHARLGRIGARSLAVDAKRNGGVHAVVNHQRLIEMPD